MKVSSAWPVVGQLACVLASIGLLTQTSVPAHVVGWLMAALIGAVFFAGKKFLDLRAGTRRVRHTWVEVPSAILIWSGLGMGLVHAFFVATEWAK